MTASLYKKYRKVRVYRYRIKVIGKGQDGYESQAKKAFAIQNRYRAEKGAKALTWSDELYRFALYRLKNSGYDRHKNLPTNMESFFWRYIGSQQHIFRRKYGVWTDKCQRSNAFVEA